MVMNFLRERAGFILIGFIGLAIVAFIFSDFSQSSQPFIAEAQSEIASIAGEDISYVEFDNRLQLNIANFKAQTQQNNVSPEMNAYFVDQTWDQLVRETIMNKQLKKSGITVSPDELFDMVQGRNIHPAVRQTFANPQTGFFDPQLVINFLRTMDQQDPSGNMRVQWLDFEKKLIQDRAMQKYNNLIRNSLYVTNLEIQNSNVNSNRTANVTFALMEITSVPDSLIKVTDSDIQKYYKENKYKYRQKDPVRSFEYIVFDLNPSSVDSANALKEIESLTEEFRTTTNDSLFAAINADTKTPIDFTKSDLLSPELNTNLANAVKGTIYGPYFDNGAFRVAKLLDIKTLPDSVRASHILISTQNGGGTAFGRAKLDSLKNLVTSGKAKFEDLAIANSNDGSADKGGDLGYFGREAMVKPFADACFENRTGDLIIVDSQFGSHLILIKDQKNFNKQVKIATVDRLLEPSQLSRQNAFAKANEFLANSNDGKRFTEAAEEAGLVKRLADNVKEIDQFVAGIESPRPVVQWAFRAKIGELSTIFEQENKYIVARLTQIRDQGFVALEYIRFEIESYVRVQKKGEYLLKQANEKAAGITSMEQFAQANQLFTRTDSALIFSNPLLNGLGREANLFGKIFTAEVGKISAPILGDRGVYIFKVNSFTEAPVLNDVTNMRTFMITNLRQRAEQAAFEALKENAKIVDRRGKFF